MEIRLRDHNCCLFDHLFVFAPVFMRRKYYYWYYIYLTLVIVALALNSIAQLFVLPTPLYLSEVWFSLEKRPFAIALGFYSNLLGFGTGGTVSSLLSYNSVSVKQILLIFSCVSCFSLVVAIIAIKNKPKVRIEIIKQTNWGHAK